VDADSQVAARDSDPILGIYQAAIHSVPAGCSPLIFSVCLLLTNLISACYGSDLNLIVAYDILASILQTSFLQVIALNKCCVKHGALLP
jgi:hypothetical protein